jgi:hypothetical protein
MAESDFLSYSSIYETFSKGPKSIYYGVGDEMLPGAILNVPQNDEDDEWGRTQRISEERTLDFIAKIYKTLFDPYDSLADISLTPGESGSEINVAKNIIRLVGRAGIDIGVFDLSIPSMTLGDVVVNGGDNSILIGSGFEATETTLKLNTFYEFAGTATEGTLAFKNVMATLKEDGSDIRFEIKVNSDRYLFSQDSGAPLLLLPVGGILQVRGTTKTNEILPNANDAYNIGSGDLRYSNIYATKLTTKDGVYSTDPAAWVLSGPNLTIVNSITSTTMMSLTYQSVTLNLLTFTQSMFPSVTEASDLGSETLKYRDIYAQRLTTNDGVYSTHPTAWELSGPNLTIVNSITSTTMMSLTYQSITMDLPTFTQSLFPLSTDNSDIGSSILRYNTIYTKDISADTGAFATSITSDMGTITSIISSFGRFTNTLTVASIVPDHPPTLYDIGTTGIPFNNIYGKQFYSESLTATYGLYSDNVHEWTMCGPNLRILVNGYSKMSVCASEIIMSEDMYTQNVYPQTPTGNYLGHSSGGGFEALYLRDQSTGLPVRVYISAGVLHP